MLKNGLTEKIRLLGILGIGFLVACGGGAPEPAAAPEPTTVPAEAEETAAPVPVEDTNETAEPTPDQAVQEEASPADSAGGSAQTFEVVTGESTAYYIVQEEFFAGALEKLGIEAGKTEVIGVSQAISGEMTLNLADPENLLGSNRFSVDLTVLQTERSQRDEWIQENGPNFARYPLAEFVGKRIEDFPTSFTDGELVNFRLVGDLTIRDIVQEVTFDVTATLESGEINGTAETDLKMADFGIEPPSFANTLTVQNDFRIRLEFVARSS